jgi:hypothetical protein
MARILKRLRAHSRKFAAKTDPHAAWKRDACKGSLILLPRLFFLTASCRWENPGKDIGIAQFALDLIL